MPIRQTIHASFCAQGWRGSTNDREAFDLAKRNKFIYGLKSRFVRDIAFNHELGKLRSTVAALKFELALLRFTHLLRKYNPDQPRVPAGNPDGGQWVSISAGWEQEANARGRAARHWPGASPRQQAELTSVQLTANRLMAEVRARDRNWRPGPGISSDTIEGAIGRANAVANEAQLRLRELGGPQVGREIDRVIRTETGGVGWRTSGAGRDVRTVGGSHFGDIAGELLHGAVPLSPPHGYN
ncbi:MAG: hypothetical protein ACRCTD_01685, partial [Beijerinckiaceae bacterium]